MMAASMKGSAKDKAVLAVDIGSLNTRALLFEIIEGRYQFIRAGSSQSTLNAPHQNLNEGVYQALVNLQRLSGRTVLDEDSRLITPQNDSGQGIDKLVLTCSAGSEIRVVLIGLVKNLDIASAENALRHVRSTIVETIGLDDNRALDSQVDAIINAAPDLIFLTGGAENGAMRSVARQAELVLLVCRLIPEEKRPLVIYAGNSRLAQKTAETLQRWTRVYTAANLRPSLENETLDSSVEALNEAVMDIHQRKLPGLQPLAGASQGAPMTSSFAYGRIVRYLSKINDPAKNIAGITIGASSTTLAVSGQGDLYLRVFPFGTGSFKALLDDKDSLQSIYRWLPVDIDMGDLLDYLNQKQAYPGLIPMHDEALAIEQSLARYILQNLSQGLKGDDIVRKRPCDPVIISGRSLTLSTDISATMLTLLNGLQPCGMTSFLFDTNDIIPSLGAIAQVNSILPVQALESRLMPASGPVICPVSRAKLGVDIATISIEFKDARKLQFTIKQGSLVRLPVQNGQNVQGKIDSIGKTVIDPYTKQKQVELNLTGGLFGVIVDARPRPLKISSTPPERIEQLKAWKEALNTPIAATEQKD